MLTVACRILKANSDRASDLVQVYSTKAGEVLETVKIVVAEGNDDRRLASVNITIRRVTQPQRGDGSSNPR